MKKILIVGLGNPGEKYVGVRHNLGFMLLDEWAKKLGVKSSWLLEKKFRSQIIHYELPTNNSKFILAKPLTFMNNSGMAVRFLVDYFKISPEDVVIIHDELDLPLGKIKVRLGGAAAGHHGVESVIESLNTDKFIRIRLGIGNLKTLSSERHGASVSVEKFVIEPFLSGEKPKIKHMIKQGLKALEIVLEKGLTLAQNQYN